MVYTTGRTHSPHVHRPPARSDGPLWIRRTPAQQEIARLAYFYWEAGGRREGTALTDWLRAERDLTNGYGN
jgi:hypothetical protein